MTQIATVPRRELHVAVRAAYRGAMAERRTEREAFESALAVLIEHRPQTTAAARRAVALMLATDPDPLGALPQQWRQA
jgi:hypothetical protein